MQRPQTSFLFDLDGTLVDSVYQHVLAWHEALETEGIRKRFNPLAGSEPTAYAATGTGTRYLPDEK
jgi:beta-phosphoglucomutase-like phosphatase (HAD superfamily)